MYGTGKTTKWTAARYSRRLRNTYLLPHDIGGLHDAARWKAVVSSQQDGLLQCHTQGAAVREKTCGQAYSHQTVQ